MKILVYKFNVYVSSTILKMTSESHMSHVYMTF